MPQSISLTIDSPLRDMLVALGQVDAESKRQISRATKADAQPIWAEETRARAATRIQQRVLVSTARISVTARNVQLRSGTTGRLSSGTPVADLATAAEFGMSPGALIATHSRKGTPYRRRVGGTFAGRTKAGKVVYPAADAAVARIGSLWIQTCARTLLDALDGGQ